MMKSDLEYYRHARTGDFEAAELPCNRGSMIAVLPAPGRSLQAVEAMLAEAPASLDAALKNEPGTVTMPEFHSVFESDVTASLQRFGIRTAFKDLKGLFDIPGSRLSEVRQAVDIQVDRRGIRADAGTVAGAIYGGVLGGSVQPFSLTLDRPFIYLVYEANSDALLFAGAVVDPSIR
jgi:serpin B